MEFLFGLVVFIVICILARDVIGWWTKANRIVELLEENNKQNRMTNALLKDILNATKENKNN